MKNKNDKNYWLDKSKNVNKLVYILYSVCALLLLVDLLYHKHVHFNFEGWFGFYAWFGFLAYTFIVMSAKLFRKLIKRQEDYYD